LKGLATRLPLPICDFAPLREEGAAIGGNCHPRDPWSANSMRRSAQWWSRPTESICIPTHTHIQSAKAIRQIPTFREDRPDVPAEQQRRQQRQSHDNPCPMQWRPREHIHHFREAAVHDKYENDCKVECRTSYRRRTGRQPAHWLDSPNYCGRAAGYRVGSWFKRLGCCSNSV